MRLMDVKDIKVRGMPVSAEEVMRFQDELGAQLFDESMFDTFEKKAACLNVITELDRRLRTLRELTFSPNYLPETIDIGDKAWIYIPVGFDNLGGAIKFGTTKDRPAGLIGWFRKKRYFRGVNFGRRH